jgi:hypothetical protein
MYCQKCGGKLDLTADEIRDALIEKAQHEKIKTTEFYAQQSMFFSILIFVIALTMVVLAGGAPDDVEAVPSATNGARYVEVGYQFEPPFDREVIPFSAKRK